MRYTFEHNDEIYMGWTSDLLDRVLEDHKRRAKAGEMTLLYSRMRVTGVDKWYIIVFNSWPTSVGCICSWYDWWLKDSGCIPVTETNMNFLSKGEQCYGVKKDRKYYEKNKEVIKERVKKDRKYYEKNK